MAGKYIYKLMATGEQLGLDQDDGARQVYLDGEPTDSLAIHFAEGRPGAKSFVEQHDEEQEIEPLEPADGSYWAALPAAERKTFYLQDEKREVLRDASTIWRMFKRDPLSPVRSYVRNFAMPGIGLFLEGYVIFSISNNSTLFKQSYRACWNDFVECNETWTQSTNYLQLVGILMGQLFFGFMGDWVGRRSAMLTDCAIILLGLIMLTLSNGTTMNGWVIMYAISQFVFGFGIGGEYPQTSTRATEESEAGRKYGQRHRGRKVMLAYTMQGWGQFVNLGTLILLFLIFNSTGNPPPHARGEHVDYSHAAAGATWRVTFALLIPLVLYVIYYRIWILDELTALKKAKENANVKGYDWRSFRLLVGSFWHRLFGTAGVWFCNDWYFYGNGVFRTTFVSILLGSNASIMTNWLYSFINAGVQLFGYYFAALSVDFKPWGRRRMTTVSFILVASIFLCVAAAFDHLVLPANIHWFQALYYLSSFFGLFGSHTTSFLLAAESYPAQVRSTAHGISAAVGKVGSIGVVVWYNYAGTEGKYWIAWPVSFLGAFICWFFIADTTGLDLAEQDRRWQYIRAGCPEDYHGPAVHPRHLSLWEKWVLGIHKQWDPEADAQARREADALKREDSAEGLSRESAVFLQRASVAKRKKLANAELGQGSSVKY